MKSLAMFATIFLSACAGTQSPIPVGDLISNPNAYQGKPVRVCGLLTDSLENCSLVEGLGKPVPKQLGWEAPPPSVWISAASEGCSPGNPHPMSAQPMRVKVVVEGTFQTGGRYGHLGLAKYQIVARQISPYTGACKRGGT